MRLPPLPGFASRIFGIQGLDAPGYQRVPLRGKYKYEQLPASTRFPFCTFHFALLNLSFAMHSLKPIQIPLGRITQSDSIQWRDCGSDPGDELFGGHCRVTDF